MVDLVLEHARLEAGGLDRERRAPSVVGADPGVKRPLDVDDDAGQAEAALLGGDRLRPSSTRPRD